jgi:beta-phosphoglucomutase-like phosphatase (HAD superfamily)
MAKRIPLDEEFSPDAVNGRKPGEGQSIAAIILDIDGTLYDQAPVRRKIAAELIRAYVTNPVVGLKLFRFLYQYRRAQEALRGFDLQGHAAQFQMSRACDASYVDVEVAREYLDRWFFESPLRHLGAAVRPEATSFLAAMKDRGIKLGAFSDYPAASKLDALAVGRFFDAVVSSFDSEVKGFKPNPSGLLLCAKKLGVLPQQVLYVGDRPQVDAECARRAGALAAILEDGQPRTPSGGKFWHSAVSFPALLSDVLSGTWIVLAGLPAVVSGTDHSPDDNL